MIQKRINVSEIKRLLNKRREALQTYHALSRFLISKGIIRFIAEEITLEFSQNPDQFQHLFEIVAKKIKCAPQEAFAKKNRVAIVGPGGVGKTTVLLKLAHYYKDRQVVIVSLEKERQDYLERESRKWGISFCQTIEECTQRADLLLIDTPSCSFYEPSSIDQIGETLSRIEEVEILLALSAATKDVDLYGAIHQFSTLGLSGLVFTKLDETLAAGALVNVSMRGDLPIHYISFDPRLPGGIQEADPHAITRKILSAFNDDSFQFLRQLSSEIY